MQDVKTPKRVCWMDVFWDLITRKFWNFFIRTHFDIIADVARLSRSYPPSEPDMVDADQSVAADLTRSNARSQTTVHVFLKRSVSTAKRRR